MRSPSHFWISRICKYRSELIISVEISRRVGAKLRSGGTGFLIDATSNEISRIYSIRESPIPRVCPIGITIFDQAFLESRSIKRKEKIRN